MKSNAQDTLLQLQVEPMRVSIPRLRLIARGPCSWKSQPPIGCFATLKDGSRCTVIHRKDNLVGLKCPDQLLQVDRSEIVDLSPSELETEIRRIGLYPVPLPEDVFKYLYESEGWND